MTPGTPASTRRSTIKFPGRAIKHVVVFALLGAACTAAVQLAVDLTIDPWPTSPWPNASAWWSWEHVQLAIPSMADVQMNTNRWTAAPATSYGAFNPRRLNYVPPDMVLTESCALP